MGRWMNMMKIWEEIYKMHRTEVSWAWRKLKTERVRWDRGGMTHQTYVHGCIWKSKFSFSNVFLYDEISRLSSCVLGAKPHEGCNDDELLDPSNNVGECCCHCVNSTRLSSHKRVSVLFCLSFSCFSEFFFPKVLCSSPPGFAVLRSCEIIYHKVCTWVGQEEDGGMKVNRLEMLKCSSALEHDFSLKHELLQFLRWKNSRWDQLFFISSSANEISFLPYRFWRCVNSRVEGGNF